MNYAKLTKQKKKIHVNVIVSTTLFATMMQDNLSDIISIRYVFLKDHDRYSCRTDFVSQITDIKLFFVEPG